MKKIKVLYYGLTGNIGGIETYLINIFRNIDKNKYDLKYLFFKGENPCFKDELGDNILYVTSRTKNYHKFCKDLKKIFSENEFDIIHFNYVDFSCFEPVLLAKKYSKAKIILHSHIAFYKMPSVKTAILNKIGTFILKINDKDFYKAGCSSLAIDYMFSKFKRKNGIILYNGIYVDQFKYNSKARKTIRDELLLEENDLLIGNVGRMVYQKNHKFLIDILDKLNKDSSKNYKLLVIGKGPLQEEIINYSKEKGVYNQLIIKKDIYNIYDYMSAMDIFVLPSHFEGLPIVLVEAQANGLYCLTTKETVSSEANITGNVTYLELDDVGKWVNKIISLEDTKRYDEIDKVKIKYDIKNSVKGLEEYYTNIVKEKA